jgi:hypothetical protein
MVNVNATAPGQITNQVTVSDGGGSAAAGDFDDRRSAQVITRAEPQCRRIFVRALN